jgi:two-component system sensor histidine kinase KdpD
MNVPADLRRAHTTGIVVGLVGLVVVTWMIHLSRGQVEVLSMAVLYQLLVLVVSGIYGAVAGLTTGLVSAVAFNWFFIPPTQNLTVSDTRNWVSLVVFTVTAIVTSYLASGFRRQRRESEARRRDAEVLTDLAETALAQVGPGHPGPQVEAAAARALGVTHCRLDLAPAALEGGHNAAAHLRPSAEGFTVPLVAGGRALGLLEVGPAAPGEEPRWATPGFALAVGGLAAVAVERGRIVETALETESLRRSDELKTALLHGVSHEFRTPLTAIRTAAHALAEDPEGPAARELLAAMSTETSRLERLVTNLLDLSRLEAGALVTRLDWCAPEEIVAGALEAAEPFLEGMPVAVRIDPDLPLVRADAVLCERILVNLLHNAVRHGRPPVTIAARRAGDRLELRMTDAGPGPDPAVAGRLFDPFAAGPGTGGTGVGLALARGLAEAQGALLEHEVEGSGTTFVLALALEPVPAVTG